MESVLVKNQKKTFGPRLYREDNGDLYKIFAHVRYDDECGNGHNTFSITGETRVRYSNYGPWREDSGGCIHDLIAKHFPELAPLIKWHLCSSDGPTHYIANTLYQARDRDHWGLRKGEKRQIVNGKTGKPSWVLEEVTLPKYVDADECPTNTQVLRYVPWCTVGEGKERDLDAARRTAVWPDATDEDLREEGLKERLEARLPALLHEFRQMVESLGFVY